MLPIIHEILMLYNFRIFIAIFTCVTVTGTGMGVNSISRKGPRGLETSIWVYSNEEIGTSAALIFNKSPYSWGLGPLFITDQDNVRIGAWSFYRVNFEAKNTRYVSSYTELGLKYSETKGDAKYFKKHLWLTCGIGINIKLNKVDQIGTSFGMMIEPFWVSDPSRKFYTGYVRFSYLLNELF